MDAYQRQQMLRLIHPTRLQIDQSEPLMKLMMEQPVNIEGMKRLASIYRPECLNEEQKKIFDYVAANPRQMVVIQGRPGTGKTFTVGCITHSRTLPTNVIIYKKDLLDPFKYIAKTYTVARFFMDLFNMNFEEYKSVIDEINGEISGFNFMTKLTELLARVEMPDFGETLIVLDEYTCIPEPLLILLLVLLKHCKVGTIVCGDHKQLHNAPTSPHTDGSSFDIASAFADRVFKLQTNMRCADTRYNQLVDYVRQISSDNNLDYFGYAIVATMFPKQLLCERSKLTDIHLAYEHKDITQKVDQLVVEQNIPFSFYYVSTTDSEQLFETQCVANYKANGPYRLGKFLPYLPLAVGMIYYVYEQSEFSLAILINVDLENKKMTLRSENGEVFEVEKSRHDKAMFDKHKEYILSGNSGFVYNYPIYPANIMSLHKSQGFNIGLPMDLSLYCGITYQALYVALSRVKSPEQIVRISMPFTLSHLVSTIINFPEHADKIEITAESLASRMADNYVYYYIEDDSLLPLCAKFFDDATPPNERQILRQTMLQEAKAQKFRVLKPPKIASKVHKSRVMKKFIDYWPIFLALSQIDDSDRNVWIREFVRCTADLATNFQPDMSSMSSRMTNEYVSPFQDRVQEKIIKHLPITYDWLAEQLNEMCKTFNE